jgi:hypothetical protein
MNLLTRFALDHFAWQTEYSIDTISVRALDDVLRYVENQQKHHALGRLRAELEHW